MRFFIGLHHPSTAWPFRRSMLSIISLKGRLRDIRINEWILDSGAFSQISRHGHHLLSPDEYLKEIEHWADCGTLLAACAQDWMCEPFIIKKTGLSIQEHQDRTIKSYLYLGLRAPVYILPVLQGFEPADYARHVDAYGSLLDPGAWVGVGSVCKRNGNSAAIEDVLYAIKARRPDLKLHGFGLKIQAFRSETIRTLLDSADSMAWSLADRYENGSGHDPRLALAYTARVESLIGGQSCFIQEQLFKWWKDPDGVPGEI